MSEKINELIKSVKDLKYDASAGNFECDRKALFEFAELIVRECMERIKVVIAEEAMNVNSDYFYYDFKQHFGVE